MDLMIVYCPVLSRSRPKLQQRRISGIQGIRMEGGVRLGLCLDCQVPSGEYRCRTKCLSRQRVLLGRLADSTATDSFPGNCTESDSVLLDPSWDWFLGIVLGFLLPSRLAHLSFAHRFVYCLASLELPSRFHALGHFPSLCH